MVSGFESLPLEFRALVPACVAEALFLTKALAHSAAAKARAVAVGVLLSPICQHCDRWSHGELRDS